ncbi:16696_t:CDS:2, partial [Gigaspora rosea]
SKSPLKPIEANNLIEDLESQDTYTEIISVNEESRLANNDDGIILLLLQYFMVFKHTNLNNLDIADQRTSVKKKRVNEESRLANNDDNIADQRTSVKKKRVNKESHLANNDNVNQPSHSYTSNNINSQRVHVSDNSSDEASSSSIRNKSLSDQRLLTSRTSPPLLLRSHSPESLYDQQSLIPNIALFSQIKEHSFHNTDYQQLPTSKVTNVSSLSLIGPFKSNLKICLYLVKHPSLINLALSMMKADGQEAAITCGKVVDKFSALPERHTPDALERAALQKWVFGCFRDYNAALRQELRNLVPEFIRKYKLTKHHMDVTDVQKTFRDQAENVDKFSNFIRSAFKLFVQEDLLDKDVVNEFKKNLNLLTVDMRIFTADGNETLQQLDLWSFLKLD